MNTPRRHLLALLTAAIAILLPVPATVRSGQNGGSVYSRYGIGDLRHTLSTRLLGMGGTGAAVRPAGAINDINPASWSEIPRVAFTAAALYEGFLTDDGTSSAYLAGVTLNGLAIAVPVDSGAGIAFALGLVPVSRVNYKVTGPASADGYDFTFTQTGEGGVSKAFLGGTFRPFPGLTLGAEFDYYFGSTRYIHLQEFASTYVGAEQTRIERFRGPGATAGMIYDGLGGLLGLPPGRGLALGVSVSSSASPDVATERVLNYEADPSNTPSDTLDGGASELQIPLGVTAGLSYTARNFIAAADVRVQDWSATTFGTTPNAKLAGSVRISGGVEFTTDAPPGSPSSQRLTYSFGAYHDAGYLEFGGERIDENGVSAGFSFPVFNETRLSLAGWFAMRGSTDGLLQEDKIFRISASMDITEFWFQRPGEE